MRPPADAPLTLRCHPATPALGLRTVDAQLGPAADGRVRLRFQLAGDLARLRMPAAAAPARTDELWRHTCGELFVASAGGPAYREFNFSPSGAWAVYDFAAYRRPVTPPGGPAPTIAVGRDEAGLSLDIDFARGWLPDAGALEFGLTLVAEESGADGAPHLSYWALRHPAERPDFHRRDSFVATLPR